MIDGPLITLALVAFNQERFIREAVESALAQTYSPLEILLSDDKSSDRTWFALQQAAAEYRGPHRIVVNQNPANLGLGGHVNAVMSRAKGELIVIAAGDDVSRADRTERIVTAWHQSGRKALSLTSHFKKIDAEGREIGEFRCRMNPASRQLVHRARHGCWNVQGCSHAWHRKVFDLFGPLQDYVVAEDRAIEFRSLALGEIAVIDDYLVRYRVHDSNLAAIPDKATRAERVRSAVKLNRIHLAMFWQFLVDLDRIEELGLSSSREVQQARNLMRQRLAFLQLEKEYLQGSGTRRLLLGIRASFLFSPKTGLKWILGSGIWR
jgi:glycosyltransferase involved in cell wall biosynthesis